MFDAVERIRSKIMIVIVIMAGLVPILWSSGGMISSTLLTLIVIPAVYGFVKGWRLPERTVHENHAQPAQVELEVE